MRYALLGDIHSSKEDLEIVLADIVNKAPDAVRMGTGDLFECTISKKDITDHKYQKLEDVMILPEGFTKLLKFESVKGNQEERILLITETKDSLRDKISAMPDTYKIGHAEIIHGHQWKWGGDPWAPIHVEAEKPLVFYGHSHCSGLNVNGVPREIEFDIPYRVNGEKVLVNVGAVVGDREWVLYDSFKDTVMFMKKD